MEEESDIQDDLVEAAKEVEILGMQIDQALSWNSQISQLKKSCAGKLIPTKKTRNCIKRETFSKVVQACVLSSVQYGDIVYSNASNKNRNTQSSASCSCAVKNS